MADIVGRRRGGAVSLVRRGSATRGIHWRPDAYAGARAMITGGLGLIGSAIARRLVALGAEVLLVDSMIRIMAAISPISPTYAIG
jgi:phosphoglycerate dehydrogenase-like enzyme